MLRRGSSSALLVLDLVLHCLLVGWIHERVPQKILLDVGPVLSDYVANSVPVVGRTTH